MHQLTIYRREDLPKTGATVHREAVRAIIFRGRKLALLETVKGDIKFPGGGIEAGESPKQALEREVREECGISMLDIADCFVETIEWDKPQERDYTLFRGVSRYYFCTTSDDFGMQTLDVYEEAWGLRPVWLSLEEALERCERALQQDHPFFWVKRALAVLRLLQTKNHPA